MKKYRKNPGAKVGTSKQIAKMLGSGAKIPTFMGKKGGHVRKKTKKKKLKRTTDSSI